MRRIAVVLLLTLLSTPQAIARAPEAATVDAMTVERVAEPLGIDAAVPRLGWTVASSRRGFMQSAYRVQVATAATRLAGSQGEPDVWDSGTVASAQSVDVEYGGPDLRARTRYYWRVQVHDERGAPTDWSRTSWWETGLTAADDWQAAWIGLPVSADKRVGYLRGELQLDAAPRRARLYSTALGAYDVTVNGKAVTADKLKPHWTDYAQRVEYQTYDVTDLLTVGDNAVGAILAAGWYAGRISNFAYGGEPPAFRAQLEVELEDGSRVVLATSDAWRASAEGPIVTADLYNGEVYNATLESGWDTPGFDDTTWSPATVITKPQPAMSAQMGPPIRVTQELDPVGITEVAPAQWVVDFGQNFAGWVRLRMHDTVPGATVAIRHAERLLPGGGLDVGTLRAAPATDVYIAKGAATETYEPRFTYHGFRYAEITGLTTRPTADDVTGLVVESATPEAGTFESSDELLNRTYRAVVWSKRSNFMGIPTDCPQRDERWGWMDALFASTALFMSDANTFYSKWTRDMREAQLDTGVFPDVVPALPGGGGTDGDAAWGDAGVLVPYALYERTGDTRVIEEQLDEMAKWVDYLGTGAVDYIRPGTFETYGDWMSDNATTRRDVFATAYYALSAKRLSQMAAAVGDAEVAAKYGETADNIKRRFAEEFVLPDGSIPDGTQTAYAMALQMDLIPTELRAAAAGHLVADVQRRGNHLSTGMVGTAYLLPALTEAGYKDTAYAVMAQETYPSFGYWFAQGATTLWETWAGRAVGPGLPTSTTGVDVANTPFMQTGPLDGSENHFTFGTVTDWMVRYVAGLRPAAPGYSRVEIRPEIGGGLSSASANHRSPYGLTASTWQVSGGTLRMTVTLPPSTEGVVHIPASLTARVTESGRALRNRNGIHSVRRTATGLEVEVGSGTYEFAVAG